MKGENEIIPVDRVVEIVKQPIKISVDVKLPDDEIWYWVEFDCWGQSCGTLFLDLDEALRWCVVGYDNNLHRPMCIKDRNGREVYGEGALAKYVMERS